MVKVIEHTRTDAVLIERFAGAGVALREIDSRVLADIAGSGLIAS